MWVRSTEVPAGWCTATTIHPTKGSAVVTFPRQHSRTPLGIQQRWLHHAAFPGSKEHIWQKHIWNPVPTRLQKLTGWLVTTSQPGLSTTAKLRTGNLKSRTLSYNLELKLTDFINTGEVAQQLHAKWDSSSPTCLSLQPHSSHCISSIQPTPSADSSTEQWHFGKGHWKGHLHRIQRHSL